jgi:predicted RNA binding protein YcfA (HicA-like mRNA interferase family)
MRALQSVSLGAGTPQSHGASMSFSGALFFCAYIFDDISFVNGKQVLRMLEAAGFRLLRIKGSHHMLAAGRRKVTVPVHGSADLKAGTLKSIEKQSGIKLK